MPNPLNPDMPDIREAHEVREHIAEIVAESFVWDVAVSEGLKLGRKRALNRTLSDEQGEVDQ